MESRASPPGRDAQSYWRPSLIRASPPPPTAYRELAPWRARSRRADEYASDASRAATRPPWVRRLELPAFPPAKPPAADWPASLRRPFSAYRDKRLSEYPRLPTTVATGSMTSA